MNEINNVEEDKFRMNAVTFIDDWGKVRLTVSISDDGKPFLAVLNKSGEISAIFSVTPDQEPYISRSK